MNDKDLITAQKAIIEELKKEMAEIEAERERVENTVKKLQDKRQENR